MEATGKSLVDTATIPAPHLEKKKEDEKKKGTPAKSAGKLHHLPAKPTAAWITSSRPPGNQR